MSSFTEATALTMQHPGHFTWDVPDGWQQGRGAWGGLVTGAAARAIVMHEPDAERTLRTISIHMSGPVVVGRSEIRVSPVRIGSNMSTWSATITDADGATTVHAIAITGRPRVPDLHDALPSWPHIDAPSLPDPSTVAKIPRGAPGTPTFLQNLDLKVVDGMPYRGGQARCLGFVRFADPTEWSDIALLSIVDAWWPTALPKLTQLRPAATVSYAAHLLAEPSEAPDGSWLAFESFMSGAHHGFTTETRRLWSPDGRLLVENHQSIALIA